MSYLPGVFRRTTASFVSSRFNIQFVQRLVHGIFLPDTFFWGHQCDI